MPPHAHRRASHWSGWQLLGNQYTPPAFEEPPRANFDTIGNAMLSLFVIAVGEGWNGIWVDTYRGARAAQVRCQRPWWLSNARCLPPRPSAQRSLLPHARRHPACPLAALPPVHPLGCHPAISLPPPAVIQSHFTPAPGCHPAIPPPRLPIQPFTPPTPPVAIARLCCMATGAAVGAWSFLYFFLITIVCNYMILNLVIAILLGSFDEEKEEEGGGEEGGAGAPGGGHSQNGTNTDAEPDACGCLPQEWQDDRSFGLFGVDNPLRRLATGFVTFQLGDSAVSFDNLIISLILVSSIAMAFDGCDVIAGSPIAIALERMDHLCTIVFVAEMIAKMVRTRARRPMATRPAHCRLPSPLASR